MIKNRRLEEEEERKRKRDNDSGQLSGRKVKPYSERHEAWSKGENKRRKE